MNSVSPRAFVAMKYNQVNLETEKQKLLKDSIEFVKEFFQLPSDIICDENFIKLCLAIKDQKIIIYDAVNLKVIINNETQNIEDEYLVIDCFNMNNFNKLQGLITTYKDQILKLSQRILNNTNTLTRGYTHLLAIGVFILVNKNFQISLDIQYKNKNASSSVSYSSISEGEGEIEDYINLMMIIFQSFNIYKTNTDDLYSTRLSNKEECYLLHADYLNIIKKVITSKDINDMLSSINSHQGTKVIKEEPVNNNEEYLITKF